MSGSVVQRGSKRVAWTAVQWIGGSALPAQDAAIVQRIRARYPDNRFDGGSDEELIQLSKRNKRVLNRSDEDVIAAMTHHR